MRRLIVFNQISLDGYFTDAHGDMSWAHKDPQDSEWNAYVAGNASSGGQLVFGRVTYEMMAGFWPTPKAREVQPVVAERMNSLPKVVFSRTLQEVSWENATLVQDDLPGTIRQMKKSPGSHMTILGSGTLIAQLAPEGLIDEYQFIVNPLVLGAGRTLFEGIPERFCLKLTRTRPFDNGNVLLSYERRV